MTTDQRFLFCPQCGETTTHAEVHAVHEVDGVKTKMLVWQCQEHVNFLSL